MPADPTPRSRFRAVVVLVATGVSGAAALLAGPLDPPAGPIGATFKTLTEVEPRTIINLVNTPGDINSTFKITSPGSYYLVSNQNTADSKSGIEIAASNVTIDLNGFHLTTTAGTSQDGMTLSGPQSNITIRNGTITGYDGDGVDMFGGGTGTGVLLEDLHCSANGADGITTGVGNIVRNCTASNNGGSGINPLGASLVVNCSATSNSSDGISSGTPGASVIGCTARSNTQNGINVGLGSLVADCAAIQNGSNGIRVFNDCTVRGNSCTGNGTLGDGAGILVAGTDNRVEGNNCTDADRGIDIDAAGNIVVRNTCSGNTTNWDVVAGNVILVVSATSSPAFTGNAGGTAPGSADPNANFTY